MMFTILEGHHDAERDSGGYLIPVAKATDAPAAVTVEDGIPEAIANQRHIWLTRIADSYGAFTSPALPEIMCRGAANAVNIKYDDANAFYKDWLGLGMIGALTKVNPLSVIGAPVMCHAATTAIKAPVDAFIECGVPSVIAGQRNLWLIKIGEWCAVFTSAALPEALCRGYPNAVNIKYTDPALLWQDWVRLARGGILTKINALSVVGFPLTRDRGDDPLVVMQNALSVCARRTPDHDALDEEDVAE